jgi:hypothetical protein
MYTIHNTTEILYPIENSAHLSPIKKYNVYAETKYNNQLKAQNTLEKTPFSELCPNYINKPCILSQ